MNTWNDLSLSEKSEMMRVAIENGITTLPEIKEAYNQFALGGFEDNKPKFQKSSEAYYDPDSDTVFAPDSTGEYYYHELFHARPDNAYLQKIAPLYSDLNDEKLIQMGADLPFVKRFEGDPGHFYSPAEVGARRAAASYMLKQAGVKSIDDTFLNEARKDELKYGNNLFSGENEPTQQMNNGLNLYRRTNNLGETEYIYQETPDSEEILLTPTNKRFSDDPSNWDYKDASGREYSPRMISPSSSSTLETSEKMGPLEKYVAELNWRAQNDPASIALQGKYTMPAIAAAPFLAWAGEAAYPYVSTALANPYVDAGLTSYFGAHGLNHAINEGIDGWGDAAMTALELAPLGQLARPMYNAGKEGLQYVVNTAKNAANVSSESPLIASAMSDYSSGLGLDYNMLGRYINKDGSLREVHIPKTVTESPNNNIDYSNVFRVDPDKRFMMFEPGSFINYDLGSMSMDDVVKTFGPEAEYYKKLYDVAKAHNFEGKYAEIGKNAEYNILNRFAIDKSDLDVARGIEEARRIYSIPEYRERFNKWGTLGDTFIDDAIARIDNVKLQGRSKKLDIKGQHGVHGGAYTTPDATTIGITNSNSSDWIYNMIRHETNHVGHGLTRQPSWMSYHNEKIRPILREGKDATSATGKYLDEMDEIVERSKTAVEYADRIRKEGESLNDALTRLADMADADIYDASIPSDIRQMMARFTKDSTLNFWKNFVGGVAMPVGIGYGLSQGNE